MLVVNIGATHTELFHGLVHLFEHWICFESIVMNNNFNPSAADEDEEADEENKPAETENYEHTLVIQASDVESISKSDKKCSITIKTKTGKTVHQKQHWQLFADGIFEH